MNEGKRLTKRDRIGGFAYFPACFEGPCYGSGCQNDDCPLISVACQRLAEYEDTYRASGWISVIDRRPEVGEEVLICTVSAAGVHGIEKGFWVVDRFVHKGSGTVTHWMPLPRLPGLPGYGTKGDIANE